MIKLSKKEVRNFVKEFKNGTPFMWKICHCSVLIRGEKIEFAVDYVGQGMNSLLYHGDYDKEIDIKDIMLDYRGLGGYNNIEETTGLIIKRINN